MTASIPNLRHRAWNLANDAVNYINKINDIIYQDMLSKPKILKEIDDEKQNDVSFSYVQELIDKAKVNLANLKTRAEFIDYIYKKHKETSDKFNNIKGNIS
jgi:hypothetical protein